MAEINIPGVSDKYKTNDLVKNLMEVERVPLTREQSKLDNYKLERECWQRVNQYMTSVRDNARGLFSYNNPFIEKSVTSSDDSVLTAEAKRDTPEGKFNVIVEQVAAADKFLSSNLGKDFSVRAGKYTFKVGEKKVSFNWRGGSLAEFTDSLNKRGSDLLKASLINVTENTKVWAIESLKTGSANELSFEDDALYLAVGMGIIQAYNNTDTTPVPLSTRILKPISQLSSEGVSLKSGILKFKPQSGAAIMLSDEIVKNNPEGMISFKVKLVPTSDITEASKPAEELKPKLPEPGRVELDSISILNAPTDLDLPYSEPMPEPVKIENYSLVYVRQSNGTESSLGQILASEEVSTVSFNISEYPDATGIIIKNFNTGKIAEISDVRVGEAQPDRYLIPLNPASLAADARVKYEGITMIRSENKIDDIIPNVTLNLQNSSSKPVSLTVDNNTEDAKSAIIEFVGNYNRLMAELNILTQTKEEIVNELEYLTDDERKDALKRLGLFQADFTLTSNKQALQRAVVAPYAIEDNEKIKMLSQIGISSKVTAGGSASPSQMRGYLEIDEKVLDNALKNNMAEIKNLFGYDADNDMIADMGVGFSVERNLNSYTQVGGIIAAKTTTVDSRIKSTETQIKKLEDQLADKEAELKTKYTKMESTLNTLESQSTKISNFSKQNSGNNQ